MVPTCIALKVPAFCALSTYSITNVKSHSFVYIYLKEVESLINRPISINNWLSNWLSNCLFMKVKICNDDIRVLKAHYVDNENVIRFLFFIEMEISIWPGRSPARRRRRRWQYYLSRNWDPTHLLKRKPATKGRYWIVRKEARIAEIITSLDTANWLFLAENVYWFL